MAATLNPTLSATLGDSITPGAWSGKKSSPYEETGASGLPHYGGLVYEEILPELYSYRWRKVVRQMTDNDATIGGLLFAIEMMIRQVEWDIAPADDSTEAKDVAQFVSECLFEDMDTTWPDTLSEILTMLPWGWAFLEVVYKARQGATRDATKTSKFDDGKIGFQRWALRAQESLFRWRFDEQGRPVAIEQLPPPTFDLRVIPIEKGLLFRTTTRKNNPEGRSILRSAYPAWYYKTNLERIEAIGIERDLAGLPVGYVPGNLFSAAAGTPDGAAFTQWKKVITNIKRDEQEGLLIPSDRDEKGNLLYDIKLLTTGGTRAFDTDAIIQRYDQRIALSVMADFLLIGHTQHSGSFGLSASKMEMFSTALSAWLDSICATINRHAFTKLLGLNNIPLELTPSLTHADVKDYDLADLGAYLNSLAGLNITFSPAEIASLKSKIKLPVPEDGEESEYNKQQLPATAPVPQDGETAPPPEVKAEQPEPPKKETPKPEELKKAAEPADNSAEEIAKDMDWLNRMLPPDMDSIFTD